MFGRNSDEENLPDQPNPEKGRSIQINKTFGMEELSRTWVGGFSRKGCG